MFNTAISGNLTRDAVFGAADSDKGKKAWLFASVAINTKVRNADGTYSDGTPTFVEVKAWGPLAENAAPNMKKGVRVIVVGTMRTETKTYNGNEKDSLVIIADEIGGSWLWGAKKGSKRSDSDIAAEMEAEAGVATSTTTQSRFEDDEDLEA